MAIQKSFTIPFLFSYVKHKACKIEFTNFSCR